MYKENLKSEIGLYQRLMDSRNYLLNVLNLKHTKPLSWYEICNVVFPDSLEQASINLGKYVDKEFSDIDDVYDKLLSLNWVVDVVDLQPVAFVIQKYYLDQLEDIMKEMTEIHNKYGIDIMDAFCLAIEYLNIKKAL